MENPVPPITPAQPTPINPPVKTGVSSLRTYQDDIAGAVNKEKASMITIALAEAKKREQNVEIAKESSFSGRNVWITVISVVLVLLAVGIVLFFHFEQKPVPIAETRIAENPILIADAEKIIPIPNLRRQNIISALQSEKQTGTGEIGAVENIRFQTGDPLTKRDIPAGEFLGALSSTIPGNLSRSISPTYVLGMHSFKKNELFIILKVDSYQNAFAGMLTWEKTMFTELGPLFLDEAPKASDFAPGAKYGNGTWSDAIIGNSDSRAVEDKETGEFVFLYSFLDKNTILITSNEDTVKEVSNRIRARELIKNN
ncbi:MAG: hypothetical protein PHS53_01520 [Candidatus Pacebacteria bacterium]|nr:hypothetical protein [Candidatus Paceibacterota bacterium]MDD5356808.1 hypothetical protein [Candidatus Paceibacterota bacterium]